jgi:poly-gamma-glutamate synthesis protein (capsule biosynthesis protein)
MRRVVVGLSVFFAILGGLMILPRVPAQAAGANWSLTAVGDIMLDRNVWAKIKANGKSFPFAKITNQLKGADVVFGNLEGPFTSSSKHAVSGGALLFNFDPSMAPVLKKVGFTVFSLANNHTLNQGLAGLNSTRTTLAKAGLQYFGDPRNLTNFHLTKTLGGQKVTFLGYHGLSGGFDKVLLDVRRAHAKGEKVIVVPHWGAEYKLNIQPALQRQGKQLIDAGADLVLGGHPHVVEPFEIYKGKFIAYSLGNFVFDQYFSADTQQGLMLKIAVATNKLTINIIPLQSIGSQIRVATGSVKTNLLNRIAKNSVVSAANKTAIKRGQITVNW